MEQKFRRSLQDVRVKRRADASSDHYLVMATLKLPQSTLRHRSFEGQADSRQVSLHLTKRFQALQELYEDSNTDLEAKREHAKQMWTSICEEVVDRKTVQHKE